MAEPGTYTVLSPAQIKAIQDDAARICIGDDWSKEMTRRKELVEQLRRWADETGLLRGQVLTTAGLAEWVRLIWQIQNLNPMQIPSLISSYGYAVHFQGYAGDRDRFREERLAEHPEWAEQYPTGGYPGVDLPGFSEDLRAMLLAIGTPDLPAAMGRVLAYHGVGKGLLTGTLSMYAPEPCPLVNNASISLFKKQGRYALTKAQLTMARQIALKRASGDPGLRPRIKDILRWNLILDETRRAAGLDDFLAIDWLLYRVLKQAPSVRGAWIFQCDPKRYDLRRALAELNQIRWQVKQHADAMSAGDRVYLWESGPEGGIVGVGAMEDEPAPSAEVEGEAEDAKYWREPTELPPDTLCANILIDRVLNPVLPRSTIAAQPALAGLSILAQAQGTNFKVTDEQSAVLDALIEGKPIGLRYWKIAPGKKAEYWERWRADGLATIGWHALGDLTGKTSEEFRALKEKVKQGNPGWSDVALDQVWAFAHLSPGDRIVANRGTREIVGVGTVTGPYSFVDEPHGHHVPVNWEDRTPYAVDEVGWKRTLVELSPEKFKRLVRETVNPPPPGDWVVHEDYALSALAAETGLGQPRLESWARAIERKGQGILYGPPGTGKTFVAHRLARHLIGGGRGFADIVQFHETYSYEDFMQGIRPETRPDGSLAYGLVPGRFMEFCREAARRGNDRCVLIIDEINRANLSRVFGELMYLLEYRDQEAPLAAGNRLRVPANVRIIGTMNTADRSIALVDHALRRRFAFLPLYPEFEILKRFHAGNGFPVQRLTEKLVEVNRAINDRNYAVGVSFFLRERLDDELPDIWRMEIEPYLEEFFFDQPDKAEAFRWERVGKDILG